MRKQGRKKGNFQGGARSANFEGSGGILSKMVPNKSIFRAFLGGAGFAREGRQTILGCQGGAPAPAPPPSFCASAFFFTLNPTSSGSDSRG